MTDQGPRPFLYSMRKLCVIPKPPTASCNLLYYTTFQRYQEIIICRVWDSPLRGKKSLFWAARRSLPISSEPRPPLP